MISRRRIRSINVFRAASILALAYVIVPAVVLIPFALVRLLLVPEPDAAAGPPGYLLTAFYAPLLFGLIGWPVTALFFATYNLLARWFGGIEIVSEEDYAVPASDSLADSRDDSRAERA